MAEPEQLDIKRIQQAARGDPEAFADVFNHFFQPVYNYALSLCGDPAQAEDLTQEGFIRAHANLGSFGPPWNFRTWIFRLVRNIFIDLTRKAKPEEPIEEARMISSADPTPEKELMLKEMAVRVRRTLGGLSPQNREVLELREMQGFSYGEMAEVMGVSMSQVGVMLHRARNSFQQVYGVKLLIEEPTEDCPEVQRLLNAYHDGEALGDREQFVRDHLKTCDACQERERWLVTQSGVFSALVPLIPPPGLAGRILERTGVSKQLDDTRRARRRMQRAVRVGGAAAGGLALAGLALAGIFSLFAGGVSPASDAPITNTPSPASATLEPQQQAAATGAPGLVPPPPVSATPTVGDPTVTVSVDTNCRQGPGDAYPSEGALFAGETAILIAWDGQGDYALIQNPDAPGECWLWLFFAEVSGGMDGLPIATPPPSPTPAATATPLFNWNGAWSMFSNGTLYTGSLAHSGNAVSGMLEPSSGNTMTINGTVSGDGSVVTGDYSLEYGGSGVFEWKMQSNLNQFTGNGAGDSYAWCGWRGGASIPMPCLGP